ncbi:conjugal transfer protein TraF [bacterium]|nr:conjugal transfer protein TraF [bacterium]
MKCCFLFFCIAVIMFSGSEASSVEFQPIGLKAMSMGGAGVASAKGSYAPYYNPALLAEDKENLEFALSAGLGFREFNIADNIDRLYEIAIKEAFDRIASTAPILSISDRELVTETKDLLDSLSDKNGLQNMLSGSFGMQIKNFGFGIYGISEASGYAEVDPNRLDIIVKYDGFYWKFDENANTMEMVDEDEYIRHSLEYALNKKLTYLQLKGLAYIDIPFSSAYQLNSEYGSLDIGGSLKVIPAWTYDQRINIDTASGQIDEDLRDAEKYDTSWGIDLGLLYKLPKIEDLSFGLSAKNLNTPRFVTKTGDTFKIRPQVRFGAAQSLFGDKLTAALDLDLTKNETFIPGIESQFIGCGVDYKPNGWLSFRGGVMRNLAESDDGTILTGGFGFAHNSVELDFSGQFSLEHGEFKDNNIPRYGWIGVGIVYHLF